jgi:hypothetical protein
MNEGKLLKEKVDGYTKMNKNAEFVDIKLMFHLFGAHKFASTKTKTNEK